MLDGMSVLEKKELGICQRGLQPHPIHPLTRPLSPPFYIVIAFFLQVAETPTQNQKIKKMNLPISWEILLCHLIYFLLL